MIFDIKNYKGLAVLLSKREIRLKKKWGQNFLFDQNLLSILAGEGNLNKEDIVLEIGPGAGLLTDHIAKHAGSVVGVEIDQGLAELCSENMRDHENVRIVHADFLAGKNTMNPEIEKLLHEISANKKELKVIANMPYYAATPAIMCMVESSLPIKLMVLIVQKELAARYTAKPGTKEYGIASILLQNIADISILRYMPNSVFFPKPKVDSAIIKIEITRKDIFDAERWMKFTAITRTFFSQRRKKLSKILAMSSLVDITHDQTKTMFKELGLDENDRCENISPEDFLRLADKLDQFGIL